MASLSQLLAAKLESEGISATKAAEKLGVAAPSFRAVLQGKSKPNKRTFAKYASFLGVAEDDVRAAAGITAKGGKAPSGKRRGRPPGSGKRRGRPPGSGKGRGRASGDARGALAQIEDALAAAEALQADDLAVRVHALGARERTVVQSLVDSLS